MAQRNTNQYQNILSDLNNYLTAGNSHAKEAEWTMAIKVDGQHITYSTEETKARAEGLPDVPLGSLAPIHDYNLGLTRGIEHSSIIQDFMPSGMHAHELKVVAPFGSITGQVHETLSRNVKVEEIVIARLGTAEKSMSVKTNTVIALVHYVFKDAYITSLLSKNDLIALSFRYTNVMYSQYKLASDSAKGEGSGVASLHDLANWKD